MALLNRPENPTPAGDFVALAWDIAREMGRPEERCRPMGLLGLVHDIGKIAVPAEIIDQHHERHSRTCFDPQVTKAALRLFREKGYQLPA